MIIYRLKNSEGAYMMRNGYATFDKNKARIYPKIGHLKNSINGIFRRRSREGWFIEESESTERLVSIISVAAVAQLYEVNKAIKEENRQKFQEAIRRDQYLSLKKEFEPAQ